MFLVDTASGRIVEDEEIKRDLAEQHPYQQWLDEGLVHLEDLPDRDHVDHSRLSVVRRQQTFGYTEEELRLLLAPMAATGAEALGSMGTDTPVAVLSARPRLLFDYFSQLFAQVTNPPLDAIREELVTALGGAIGPEPNLLEDGPRARPQARRALPDDRQRPARQDHPHRPDPAARGTTFSAVTIAGLYPVAGGGAALQARLQEIFAEVDAAHRAGPQRHRAVRPRRRPRPWRRSRRCCSPPRCTTTPCAGAPARRSR